ncbi:MAG: HDIG domain-containing protein [Bacillota bacterium]|nr:HDIG domain-containing protein [Bacillota bacterium]
MTKTTISEAACLRVLAEYRTPPHVVRHCRAVASVACAMAEALNAHGAHLDVDLIRAAGLLHDMARVHEEHGNVAADYCAARGWVREAEIIRAHMFYDVFHDADHLDETDLICLADRLVLEDRYAGIDRRMAYIIEKARRNGHPEYVPHIERRREETRALLGEIEAKIGLPLDELMETRQDG